MSVKSDLLKAGRHVIYGGGIPDKWRKPAAFDPASADFALANAAHDIHARAQFLVKWRSYGANYMRSSTPDVLDAAVEGGRRELMAQWIAVVRRTHPSWWKRFRA